MSRTRGRLLIRLSADTSEQEIRRAVLVSVVDRKTEEVMQLQDQLREAKDDLVAAFVELHQLDAVPPPSLN